MPTNPAPSTVTIKNASGSNVIHRVYGAATTTSPNNPGVVALGYDFRQAVFEHLTQYGDRRNSMAVVGLSEMFRGSSLDTNTWSSEIENSGTVAVADGLATLGSSTHTAGRACLASDKVLYMNPSDTHVFRTILQYNTKVSGNQRIWGVVKGATQTAAAPDDGYYFSLSGTDFRVVSLEGGDEADVNVLAADGLIDDANFHLYEIAYGPHGATFYQDGVKLGSWSTVGHGSLRVAQFDYRAFFQSLNTGSATNNVLSVHAAELVKYGGYANEPRFQQISTNTNTVLKAGPGILGKIIIGGAAGSAEVVTIYDNTAASGTVILTFDLAEITGILDLNLPFTTGLTVDSGGTTPFTVTWI